LSRDSRGKNTYCTFYSEAQTEQIYVIYDQSSVVLIVRGKKTYNAMQYNNDREMNKKTLLKSLMHLIIKNE